MTSTRLVFIRDYRGFMQTGKLIVSFSLVVCSERRSDFIHIKTLNDAR